MLFVIFFTSFFSLSLFSSESSKQEYYFKGCNQNPPFQAIGTKPIPITDSNSKKIAALYEFAIKLKNNKIEKLNDDITVAKLTSQLFDIDTTPYKIHFLNTAMAQLNAEEEFQNFEIKPFLEILLQYIETENDRIEGENEDNQQIFKICDENKLNKLQDMFKLFASKNTRKRANANARPIQEIAKVEKSIDTSTRKRAGAIVTSSVASSVARSQVESCNNSDSVTLQREPIPVNLLTDWRIPIKSPADTLISSEFPALSPEFKAKKRRFLEYKTRIIRDKKACSDLKEKISADRELFQEDYEALMSLCKEKIK